MEHRTIGVELAFSASTECSFSFLYLAIVITAEVSSMFIFFGTEVFPFFIERLALTIKRFTISIERLTIVFLLIE